MVRYLGDLAQVVAGLISLILTASIVLVTLPPDGPRCEMTELRIIAADGRRIDARRATYSPSGRRITVTPTAGQPIFCNSFEATP